MAAMGFSLGVVEPVVDPLVFEPDDVDPDDDPDVDVVEPDVVVDPGLVVDPDVDVEVPPWFPCVPADGAVLGPCVVEDCAPCGFAAYAEAHATPSTRTMLVVKDALYISDLQSPLQGQGAYRRPPGRRPIKSRGFSELSA